jgi:hypothetical protein
MRVANMAWTGAMFIGLVCLASSACVVSGGDPGTTGGSGGAPLSPPVTGSGTGGSCDCVDANGDCEVCAPDAKGIVAGTNDPQAAPPGMGAQCPSVADLGSNVSRVPDDTRSFDSAVYAHVLLERVRNQASSTLPDPSRVRLADIANFYSYTPGVNSKPTGGDVDVDLWLAPDMKSGNVIGRFIIPPASQRRPIGLLLVLDTSSSLVRHDSLRRLQIAAAETLVSRLTTLGDDAIIRTWTSAPLASLTSGAADLLHSAEETTDALPADPANDTVAMLEGALSDTAKLQIDDSGARHVVVFTDGGASTKAVSELVDEYRKAGVTLDAIQIADATALAESYDSNLLAALAPEGARLVVTDQRSTSPMGTSAFPDVDAIIGKRFDELFGVAFRSLRVTFAIPGLFQPVTVEVEPNAGSTPTTLDTAEASPLRRVSIGAGRTVTIQEPIMVDANAQQANVIYSYCGDYSLSAAFTTDADTPDQNILTSTKPLNSFSNLTPEAKYDAAVVAFAQAIRTSGASAMKAQALIYAAHVDCTSIQNPEVCANLVEMAAELAVWAPSGP